MFSSCFSQVDKCLVLVSLKVDKCLVLVSLRVYKCLVLVSLKVDKCLVIALSRQMLGSCFSQNRQCLVLVSLRFLFLSK